MLIDCETCAVRDVACGDCVVTFLFAALPVEAGRPTPVHLDPDEAGALQVLAEYGLVPPLRLDHGDEAGTQQPPRLASGT